MHPRTSRSAGPHGLLKRGTLWLLIALALVTAAFLPTATAQETPAGDATAQEVPEEPAGAAPSRTREMAEDFFSHLPSWFQYKILGMAFWQMLMAFVLILLGLVLKKVSDAVFEKKLVPLLRRTPFAFDDLLAEAVSKPLGFLFLLTGFAGAFTVLPLPSEPDVHGFVFGALKVCFAGDVLWLLFRGIDMGVGRLGELAGGTESSLDVDLLPLIRKALKLTVGAVCAVWVVQLLGYNVSSLLAGLGIGGLAVALALQDALSNFFGSVFIFLDRPFSVGDWIKVADVEGIVEAIGFRSTRIRTWPATLVAVPNKTMASATVDNWSRMPKRRVVQTVGLTYDTTVEQMEQAVAAIRQVVENDEGVDKELIVIHFTDFGESSLNILVYYFTTAVGFDDHLATKERVNMAIMRALADLRLSIAFPTHTVHLGDSVVKDLASRLIEQQAGKS